LWDDGTGLIIVPPSPRAEVIDDVTGEVIPYCTTADDATGEYEQYVSDDRGLIVCDPETGATPLRRGKAARLRFNFLER
jgi:hypothetical protein